MRKPFHFALAWLLAVSVAGACGKDARLDAVTTAWLAHQSQQPLDDLNAAQALCFRQQFLKKLARTLGPVVGYKVGVYTATARKTYATSSPEVGVLLEGMLADAGASVSVSRGVATVSEADFLLVVKDAGINQAKTREEAYRHVRGYRAFVELPDLNYLPTPKPSLSQLVALNVNARAGVMGAEIPLPQTPAGFDGLSQLTADVTIEGAPEGALHTRGIARETLGDPLEILLAARDGLKKEGVKLKAGDVVSIGTLTPPRPVKAGETLIIRYTVETTTADISVKFVP